MNAGVGTERHEFIHRDRSRDIIERYHAEMDDDGRDGGKKYPRIEVVVARADVKAIP